jgi:hypothetical protein
MAIKLYRPRYVDSIVTTMRVRVDDRALLEQLGNGKVSRGLEILVDSTRKDIEKFLAEEYAKEKEEEEEEQKAA